MRERPILFSAPMVRALLDDTKTQTRRVVSQKHLPWIENRLQHFLDGKWDQRPFPYGQRGDRLWVRETWRGVVNIAPPGHYEYAVARYVPDQEHCRRVEYAASQTPDSDPWRPSIHMPRWASRITLEITGVRLDRLQDISEADCIAEGTPGGHGAIPGYAYSATPKEHYRQLWQSINGDGSWDLNPMVWVIEFKRVLS